jgi:peptidoglycan/xylan/chitin deacetylase (PgdA/CDA1 family)
MVGPRVTRLPNNFRWPGGHHIALIFNIAYEAWSQGKAPGIGPMGNPLPAGAFDANALSWGNYGSRTGIERLLRILDRKKVQGSVMVSGVLAERTPDQVRAIAEAGHEIVAHSYAQDMIPTALSKEESRENIARTTTLLEQVSGVRPKGWISPRGTAGTEALVLLAESGYEWHSDVLDEDKPYLQRFDHGQLLAIPFTVEINDLSHAMRYGRTPRQFVDMFDDFLSHALLLKDDVIIIDVTAHAHCYGRPGGAWAYEEIVGKMARREDVWITTRQKIANAALRTLS